MVGPGIDSARGGTSDNPMGAAAMTLSGGGKYAIHNAPGTVGGFVSHGCFPSP
jgi:lipoprotein-anchoring transpeptidase ErfK/SrfK